MNCRADAGAGLGQATAHTYGNKEGRLLSTMHWLVSNHQGCVRGCRHYVLLERSDIRLFIDGRSAVLKIQNPDAGRGGSGGVEIDTTIAQLVNEAVTADEVVDSYQLDCLVLAVWR